MGSLPCADLFILFSPPFGIQSTLLLDFWEFVLLHISLLNYSALFESGLSFQMMWPSQQFVHVFPYYTNPDFSLKSLFVCSHICCLLPQSYLFAVAVMGPLTVYRSPRVLRHASKITRSCPRPESVHLALIQKRIGVYITHRHHYTPSTAFLKVTFVLYSDFITRGLVQMFYTISRRPPFMAVMLQSVPWKTIYLGLTALLT